MNDLVPRSELAISRVSEARALLAEARSLDDVLELRDQAEAMRVYLKRREDASEAHADAWAIAQEANRRLGELCRELPKHPTGGGRPRKDAETSPLDGPVSKAGELKRLGLTKQEASRLERLAALPEEEFAARIELGRAKILKLPDPAPAASTEGFDRDSYGTPPEYAEAARTVLGGIELDPASNERSQLIIQAQRYYTAENNGLTQEWKARSVFLNPPYSEPLVSKFGHRWCEEFGSGHFVAGLLLVNACTETGWFQRALGFAAVCFPDKRIAFLGPDNQPVKGNEYRQAVLYAGPKLPLFRKVFGKFGRVLVEA